MSMDEYALYDRDEPALSGVERELYDAVSADEPWALVERFADLERVSPSADERAAAAYLEERLSALSIPYDRYDPELYLSTPEDASLALDGESFDAVKTVSFGASGAVEAPLLLVEGDDEGDPFSGTAEAGREVEGRVAVIEGRLPIGAIRTLEDRGAAAVVVVHEHDREPHEGIATPVWGAVPHPDRRDRIPDVPVVSVARPVGDRLFAAGDGATVSLAAEVDTRWAACPVIVAEVAGRGETADFVLLHGHYDSWHVGLTDNATGDGGLLECARVFSDFAGELERDLRVAWWPGHSTGRYAGSTWYADQFANELDEHCVAQVNMDSPGVADATEFDYMTVWMPEADALARGAIDDVAGKEANGARPPRAGDYSFTNLGITGLFMLSSSIPAPVREARGYHGVGGSGGNSDAWHLSTDTIEKADPDVLVRDVRVYVTALARLLRAQVLPLDHRRTVYYHRRAIEKYDDAAGEHFDLGPVIAELSALDDALDAFHDALEAGTIPADEANETMKALSRRLLPPGFVERGRFEQDPAINAPPFPTLEPATDLPDLDGDERRFLARHLVRARNAVVHDLRRARDAVPVGE